MEAAVANLLVVDDDPEIRELTEAYLCQQGFEVGPVKYRRSFCYKPGVNKPSIQLIYVRIYFIFFLAFLTMPSDLGLARQAQYRY